MLNRDFSLLFSLLLEGKEREKTSYWFSTENGEQEEFLPIRSLNASTGSNWKERGGVFLLLSLFLLFVGVTLPRVKIRSCYICWG